jgi:hypothetical protein
MSKIRRFLIVFINLLVVFFYLKGDIGNHFIVTSLKFGLISNLVLGCTAMLIGLRFIMHFFAYINYGCMNPVCIVMGLVYFILLMPFSIVQTFLFGNVMISMGSFTIIIGDILLASIIESNKTFQPLYIKSNTQPSPS